MAGQNFIAPRDDLFLHGFFFAQTACTLVTKWQFKTPRRSSYETCFVTATAFKYDEEWSRLRRLEYLCHRVSSCGRFCDNDFFLRAAVIHQEESLPPLSVNCQASGGGGGGNKSECRSLHFSRRNPSYHPRTPKSILVSPVYILLGLIHNFPGNPGNERKCAIIADHKSQKATISMPFPLAGGNFPGCDTHLRSNHILPV